MRGGRHPAGLSVIARLQELVTLESRRTLELAAAQAEVRAKTKRQAEDVLAASEASYAELLAQPMFDPVRALLAGAILNHAVEEDEAQRAALLEARNNETAAGLAWQRDRHREEWFCDQSRQAAKAAARQRDVRAEDEVRQLRLALRQVSIP